MNVRRFVLALTLSALPLAVGASRASGEDDEARGYVGFSWRPVPILTDAERKDLGVTADEGIVVTDVVPGMPADLAGLKRSDLIRKYNGAEVPVTKGMDPKDADALKKVEEAFQKVAGAVKPGEEVVLVVERAGQAVTVVPTAVNKATRDRLVAAAEEEQIAPKIPDLKTAGAPVAASWDFETIPDDRYQPADFYPWRGVWEAAEEEGSKPANQVLKQSSSAEPWAVCIVAGNGRAYADGTVSVRFMPLSGQEDASGGILFRAQDRKTFYFARANALEDNLRIYVVKDGKRTTLASTEGIEKPKLRTWHTLEVTFVGTKFKATLDGKSSVEGTDGSFASGWCGLWTKADSETQFDDMKMTPAPAK